MSTDLTAIDAQIAELQQMRESIIKADKAEAIILAKQFIWEYDYSVTWPHPAQVRIERTITSDCQTRVDNFNARFPNHCLKPFVGGMTYSVLEGGYMLGGGGCVIVNFHNAKSGHSWSSDPQPIRPADLAALRRGEVPLSIRKP